MSSRFLVLYAALIAGCSTSTSPVDSANDGTKPAVDKGSLALSALEDESSSGVTLKRRGDAVVVADLRGITDSRKLESAISAIVESSSVEEVILGGRIVSDEVLAPLIETDKLKRLRVEESSLSDATVAKLAQLNRLDLLYLTDATGLTEAGVLEFGAMTKLRNLRIGGEMVTDRSIIDIANLKNLEALGLVKTNVTDTGLYSLQTLENLKELMLFATPVTDASFEMFRAFPNLKVLRLRQSAVTGQQASALARLTVSELELAETGFVNSGLDAIAKMPELTKLNLWLTQIDNAGVAKLRGMTQLTSLNLDNLPPVDNDSIDTILSLPNLEFLHLGKTSVTIDGLKRLSSLTKLKTLLATQLGVTEEDANAVKASMPSLKRFDY